MARPLGPPPVAENRLTWPSRVTREQRLLRISVSTIEPSAQATGPSGKPRPVATMVTSLMVVVSPFWIASGTPAERSRLLRQDDMGGVVRGGVLRALVAEAHRIDAGEEVLAPAQKHGGEHEVDLVDQPGAEVLADGGNSPAESDVLT